MNNLLLKKNLTKRQLLYISEIASGLSTINVAARNHVSRHTVRNTIRSAKDRIGATSTSNLIATTILKEWIVPLDNEMPLVFRVNDG